MYQLRSYPASITGRLDHILRASRIVSKHATATEAQQERARLELKRLDRVYFVTDELGNLLALGFVATDTKAAQALEFVRSLAKLYESNPKLAELQELHLGLTAGDDCQQCFLVGVIDELIGNAQRLIK